MPSVTHVLQTPAKSGVYRVVGAEAVEREARSAGAAIAKIRLAGKASFLRNIAAALDFPDWFGGNWDALEDCLTDLGWRPAAVHLLVLEDLAAMPREELGVLIDVLAAAAQFWADQGRGFFAVFIDPRGTLELPELGSAA